MLGNCKNQYSFLGINKVPRQNMRDRILEIARDKFFQFGFTRVTVDEIAQDLGVSKKTLYKHFPSKEALLREIMKQNTREIEAKIDAILKDRNSDFVEKLRGIWAFLASRLSRIGQAFQQDLQRHVPEVWKEVDQRRNQIIRQRFGKMFQKGVQSKAIRRDIDAELLVLVYVTLVQRIVNPETLSQLPLSMSQAFETIISVMFEGILTDQARRRFRARPVPG
jgi:AcrR family transcriptional regulator